MATGAVRARRLRRRPPGSGRSVRDPRGADRRRQPAAAHRRRGDLAARARCATPRLRHHGGGTAPAGAERAVPADDPRPAVPDVPASTSAGSSGPTSIGRCPAPPARAAAVAVPTEYVRGTVIDAYGLDPRARRRRAPRLRAGAAHRRHAGRRAARHVRAGRRAGARLPGGHQPAQEPRVPARPAARRAGPTRTCGSSSSAATAAAPRSTVSRPAPIAASAASGGCRRPTATGSSRMADALVFPSRYEGFGAPLIEAMALGTPVIAADTTCIPEVVGDAGVVVAARRSTRGTTASTDVRAPSATSSSPPATGGPSSSPRRAPARPLDRAPTDLALELAADAPRRALPALRTGHRADRRGDHPDRARARRAAATASTSSRRCPGTATTPSSRAGPVGGCATSSDPWGSITRVRPVPRQGQAPHRPPCRRVRRLQRAGRRAGGCAAGGSTAVLAMSPPFTMGLTGWACASACAGARSSSTSRTCSPTRRSPPGRSPTARLIAVARRHRAAQLPDGAAPSPCVGEEMRANVAAKMPAGRGRRRGRHPQLRRHRRRSARSTGTPRCAPSSASATSRW